MPSIIQTTDYINVTMDDGHSFTATPEHEHFDQIVAAIAESDFERAKTLSARVHALINLELKSVTIKNGTVYHNGKAFDNTLTQRMLDMIDDGLSVEPLMLFMDNLMSNPSHRSITELYTFLEYGQLPVTEDGHFLAYKLITHDYKDVHTRTIDNSIGAVVEMTRNAVNDDARVTCSTGLHFCSREYLSKFSGDRLVVLKINPRDVVSIPYDYNNTKGRCCRYTVLCELSKGDTIEGLFVDTKALTHVGDDSLIFETESEADKFVADNRGTVKRDRGQGAEPRWIVKKV